MLFGKKAKPIEPVCDVCETRLNEVMKVQFGYLCERCIDRAVYMSAFVAAGKDVPELTPPPPRPSRPLRNM